MNPFLLGKHYLEAAGEDEALQGQSHLAKHEGAVSEGATISILSAVKLLLLQQVIAHKIDSYGLSRKEVCKFREGLGIETNLVFFCRIYVA